VPEVVGPKLIEILWKDALRAIEGPDSQGAPIDPAEVWTRLHETLAALGLELDLRASAASATLWPTHVAGIPVEEMIRLASGYTGEG
jgi:hypothetical protein